MLKLVLPEGCSLLSARDAHIALDQRRTDVGGRVDLFPNGGRAESWRT